MIGKTLSHYKVLEKIGQGGMGEVYRAEDTNLDREVAIKVLPEQFTKDPQRLARFEREAKLLAQLNHPNIAAIYGLEEADGVRFLALELVPGETLQERVAKGPVPVEEALEVCRQIAEGVEAAHEKGVIHRDLKPANVKVTPNGKVKILDFGLAKAFEAETPVTDISQSPTLTEEMTRAGVILGTAAYMSPEQAKDKPVDKRADVFAFGAVLYELLTGKRAFEGETITETIAAVLKSEPDWEKLPSDTPWRIKELLDDCLQKEAHDRSHDISHTRIQIKKALKEPATASPTGVSSRVQSPAWRKAVPWSIAAVALVIAGVAVWNLTPSSIPASLTTFALNLPSSDRFTTLGHEVLALSPDGTRLVYSVANDQLYLREMDQLESQPIPGTQGADGPFFSPGGQWVGFTAGALKKVSITGGAPVTLSDDVNIHGASWGADDTIIFAPNSGNRGLFRISAAGRDPVALTTPDPNKSETAHSWPQILPGGQAVLFTVWTGGIWDDARIVVEQIEERERRVLIEGGTHAQYVPTGHLVYSRANTLMAVPFDLARLEITGSPLPVVVGVWQGAVSGVAQFAFSDLGSLVYVPGSSAAAERTLVWVNRQGDG
jgi:serine/threonine-protein kinase